MNPLNNTLDENIKLGYLTVNDIPKFGFEHCTRPEYYKWLSKELTPELYKLSQQYFEEARIYLKNCGKPKDECGIYLIQYYKDLQKSTKETLSGKLLYQSHIKTAFEKTDKYKILVLQNSLKELEEAPLKKSQTFHREIKDVGYW